MTDSVKIYPGKKKPVQEQAKTSEQNAQSKATEAELQAQRDAIDEKVAQMPTEHGGRAKEKGLEPTRYGDWEFKGRCIDF